MVPISGSKVYITIEQYSSEGSLQTREVRQYYETENKDGRWSSHMVDAAIREAEALSAKGFHEVLGEHKYCEYCNE